MNGKTANKKDTKKKVNEPPNSPLIIKKLIKIYNRNCNLTQSKMCARIVKALRRCIAKDILLYQFIFEPVDVANKGDIPVLIDPFLAAIRQARYTNLRDLYVWRYPMSYENTSTLALLLEQDAYPVSLLELMDCLLDPLAVLRLSCSIKVTRFLTCLNLDYNEFGNEGCTNLCKGLEENKSMLSISLCYCNLGVPSGATLGLMLATTAVRELYVDGNNLLCEGAIEIIKPCAQQAVLDALIRQEEAKKMIAKEEAQKAAAAKNANWKSGNKDHKNAGHTSTKKKDKNTPQPPRVGPWIHKLHLADNGIDMQEFEARYAPVLCMRLFKKLLMHSDCFEELDLKDNSIGDLAAMEILEALEHRQEANLNGIKVRTTHKISEHLFNCIVKLGSGQIKTKRKGKKKKKMK